MKYEYGLKLAIFPLPLRFGFYPNIPMAGKQFSELGIVYGS
jgi:hypothetical protein